MSASKEAEDWASTVQGYAGKHDLRYEPVGGINPKDGPVALCVGGTNRLTGQLDEEHEFWGSSCDADEHEEGGLFSKAVLPGAVLATLLWFPATMLFGWYVTNYATYTAVYGSLSAAIALLVWLYIVSVIVLLGAELNAQWYPKTVELTSQEKKV